MFGARPSRLTGTFGRAREEFPSRLRPGSRQLRWGGATSTLSSAFEVAPKADLRASDAGELPHGETGKHPHGTAGDSANHEFRSNRRNRSPGGGRPPSTPPSPTQPPGGPGPPPRR